MWTSLVYIFMARSMLDVDQLDALVDRKDKLLSKLYKRKLEACV